MIKIVGSAKGNFPCSGEQARARGKPEFGFDSDKC